MMDVVGMQDKVAQARRHTHALAGLLTGALAGLECMNLDNDATQVSSYAETAQKLIVEAQVELVDIHSILSDLARDASEKV